MNNQKQENLEQESTITVVPLATSFLHAPYISDQLISLIQKQKEQGKKTIIFYNRRGNSRALICEDCGHFERCPECDIAMAYHTTPSKQLICHQCNHTAPYPLACPHCRGVNFISAGVGLQRVETDLQRALSASYTIVRIDSDNSKGASHIMQSVSSADVILTTSMAIFLRDPHIGAVVFLCFEINLSLPEYDFEEQLFSEISYFKKQHLPIYIQTYTPDHPLIDIITYGNYQTFLSYLKEERKQFHYPPFTELATIRIHDPKKERVQTMMTHLVNKISQIRQTSTFLAFDRDIWEKYAGEWVQKIVLKDKDLSYLVHQLEVEIVRNRSVTLEWK